MIWQRFSQYPIQRLFVILLYKVVRGILLRIEEIKSRVFSTTYREIKTKKCVKNEYDNVIIVLKEFFNYLSKDKIEIIKRAEKILAGENEVFNYRYSFDYEKDWLKDPGSNNYWDNRVFFANAPTRQNGCWDVKYVLEVNKFNHLVYLAQAYYFTHDDRYIENIEKQLQGWIKCVPYERSVANRIIMDMAFRCINLIQISLLCHDSILFQENVRPVILGILSAYESQIRRFSTPRWFKTGNGANHTTGEMVGLIIVQLWLSRFTGKSYKWHFKAEFKYLHDVLDRTIAPSGAYLEQSGNYSRLVAEFLIIFDIFLKGLLPVDHNTKRYLNRKYLERLLVYLRDLSYHGNLPNFGDNDNARVLLAFRPGGEDVEYVLSYLGALEVDVIQPCHMDKYLDGSQVIYKSMDENDVMLFTRVGAFSTVIKEGFGGHVHNDLLAVILGVKGIPLFIDKGCSFYNKGRTERIGYISSAVHNSIHFDGVEMVDTSDRCTFTNFPQSELLAFSENPISYECTARLQYKDISHIRTIRYDGEQIVITDIVNSDFSHGGVISYLLGDSLSVAANGDNRYLLVDQSTLNEYVLRFEGVNSSGYKVEDYYPRFAENVSTHRVFGQFVVSDMIRIRTIIEIDNNDRSSNGYEK